MSRPDIDAIHRRLLATTQGKWIEHDHWIYVDDQGLMFTRVRQDQKEEAESLANRTFAAHAHQDIPALLAYVEELEKHNGVLRTCLTGAVMAVNGLPQDDEPA